MFSGVFFIGVVVRHLAVSRDDGASVYLLRWLARLCKAKLIYCDLRF
jgi:hypothetical protein